MENFVGFVQLLGDSSVVRRDELIRMPPGLFPDIPSVQWSDLVYNSTHGLMVRMYRPAVAAGSGTNKIPVMVHFHGGG